VRQRILQLVSTSAEPAFIAQLLIVLEAITSSSVSIEGHGARMFGSMRPQK